MRVLVDADACPVLELVRRLCAEAVVKVITVSSFRHDIRGPDHVMVGPEPQAADMALINRTQRGDIVVTQDWGLAALALARGPRPQPLGPPLPGRRDGRPPGAAGAARPAAPGGRAPARPEPAHGGRRRRLCPGAPGAVCRRTVALQHRTPAPAGAPWACSRGDPHCYSIKRKYRALGSPVLRGWGWGAGGALWLRVGARWGTSG